MTKISWAHETWSPITGCTPVSEGCQHCYAKRMAYRLRGRFGYPQDEPFRVTFHPDRLDKPLGWKKPRTIFVCSMADLWHNDVKPQWRGAVFNSMRAAPWHRYMLLTKRPQNIPMDWQTEPNWWVGLTVESAKWACRIADLLLRRVPHAFLSLEPLLGPLDLLPWLADSQCSNCGWLGFTDNDDTEGGLTKSYAGPEDMEGRWYCPECGASEENAVHDYTPVHNAFGADPRLEYVIIGCESGPGRRPTKLEWVKSICEQCWQGGVPIHVKQIDIGGKVCDKPEPIAEALGTTVEQIRQEAT